MKTLVYHAGALGDFITIVPSINRWKEMNPQTEIIFFGKNKMGELGVAAGIFQSVWDIDSARFSVFFTPQSSRAASGLKGIDAAILFTHDHAPLLQNLKQSGMASLLHHAPSPPEEIWAPAYHLRLVDPGGDNQLLTEQALTLPPWWDQFLVSNEIGILSAPVILHPGSGSKKKNWPLACYIKLSRSLTELGFPVLWILGPAEEGMSIPAPGKVLGDPPLIGLGRILSAGRLFIGNDSGIAHFSGAVGCPCLVLFGPSNPRIWKPAGPRVNLLCSPTNAMTDIEPATVLKYACAIMKTGCSIQPTIPYNAHTGY